MSHDERFKGRDKKTHKMTRDGLVERNAATGEESRISQRRQDFKLRDRLTEGADGRGPAPDSERGARSQRRPQAFTQEEAIPRINQTQTADSSQNIRQLDVDFRSENTTHTTSEASHTLDADDKALPSEPAISQRGGEQARPSRQHGSRYQRQFQSDTQGGVDLPARDADTSPISDVPPFQVTLSVPPAGRKSDGLPLDELLTPAGDGISYTPPAMERPGRLLFDASAPAAPAGTKPNQRGTGYARKFMEKQPAETVGGTDRQGTSAPDSHSDNASDGNPAKPSRLQFGKEELPPPKDAGAGSAGKMDKRLEKSRLKAEHSAKKLAAAKKKLPTRKKLRLEKSFDAEHGEVKRQLRFEQEVKSQRAHLKGPVPTRPVKAGANAAIGYAHTKIHQAEQENVGVEAGHKGELMADGLARRAYRLHKTAPYRRVAKWERRTQKHAVNHAYRQALHDNPQLQSSTLSRFLQKQRIKRQYAKAAREAKRGAKAAKKAGENAAKLTQAVIGFVRRHPVGVGIALLILMMVLLIMTMFGSCSNMALGVLSSVTTGSYVAEDRDIDDAELYYTEWEADLQIQIDNAERDHPGFDEYRYNVDDISHDPYTQSLYEKKLCTYPRTDSRFLTEDMAPGLPALVFAVAGNLAFLPAVLPLPVNADQVVNNGKVSDHHAIIPTPTMAAANLDGLPAGERNILHLMAVRLLCAVGEKHSHAETAVTVECAGHLFTAKGSTVLREGWKAAEQAFRATLKEKPQENDADDASLPELSEGQVFSSVAASVREGFSSPPKHFTEDTLLSAMESAGSDDAPEDAERKGLGTPATRAGIIEKLVKSDFVARKSKQLFPTEKGVNLIAVLPDIIKSPQLTAEWEHMLGRIERGELVDADFMEGIAAMTRDLVSAHAVPDQAHSARFARPTAPSVGVCPRCGSAVTESKKGFFCSGRDCRFALWRDNKFFAAKKKEITKPIAAALLTEGRVFIKGLYSEKTGKTYDATVVLEDTGRYANFKLDFERRGRS